MFSIDQVSGGETINWAAFGRIGKKQEVFWRNIGTNQWAPPICFEGYRYRRKYIIIHLAIVL